MVLKVHGREEFKLETYLVDELGGEGYAPRAKLRRYVRRVRQVKEVETPVFSGYVFGRGFSWRGLREAPGHTRICVIRGYAVQVSDAEIERIRQRVAAGEYDDKPPEHARPGRRFAIGDVVGIDRNCGITLPPGSETVEILALPRSGRGKAEVEFPAYRGKPLKIDVGYLHELR